MMSLQPGIPAEQADIDIAEMLGWLGARFHVWRDESGRKVPYTRKGHHARSNDPNTWTALPTALAELKEGKFTGLAIELGCLEDGRWLVGADLDLCRNADGTIHEWALAILRRLPTYAEISPSGSGIKLLGIVDWLPDCLGTGGLESTVHDDEPLTGHQSLTHKKPEIGLYPSKRFFALTGQHLIATHGELCDITEAFSQLAFELRQTTPARAALAVDASGIELARGRMTPDLLDRILAHPLAGPRWSNSDGLKDRSQCDFRLADDMALDFTQAEVEAALREFPHGQIGSGKLIGYAADRQIKRLIAKAVVPATPKIDTSKLLANGHDHTPHDPETGEIIEPPMAAGDIASIVATAPGAVGRMTRWMVDTAVSPQPLLSLGAALCAYGTAMGRQYRLDRPDTRSNVYVIALADSGAGKDHPRRCVRRAMIEAGLAHHLGGETLASGAAVMSSIAQFPCRLFQVDEFGHFIQAVLDPKSHAHHRREIMTNLTTLWSSASEIVIGTEYANQKDRPRVDIHEPCVCVYGSTVPMTFWRSLQSGNVTDGSLARFLILQTLQNYPDDQSPKPIADGLPQIVADLKAVAAGAVDHHGGNLGMVSGQSATPYTVPMSPQIEALDAALRAEHLALKRKHENSIYSSIVARFREHVRRIMLIAAVADDPARPMVRPAHFEWAVSFVRWTQNELMQQAERYIADSLHEASLKKLLDIIRRHGGWMDQRSLVRKTQFLSRRDRNEQISQLQEAGHLELSLEQSATKPRTLIRAVG